MRTRRIDRRVARTRAKLHEALLALLERKSYEALTVEAICAKARIGRSTFYAHYAGKEALMRGGIETLRERLRGGRDAAAATGRGFAFSALMLDHASGHAHLHKSLLGNRGGAIALGAIREILCERVREELGGLRARGGAEAVPREFLVQYVVGAYMAVLQWWLDQGARLPPARLDALFQRVTEGGIGALAG